MGTQLSPKKGHSPPIFGLCPLWPNSWMDQDATWYGGRPRPRRHCVRWGPSSSPKRGRSPLPKPPAQFLAHVYCGKTAGWIKMALGMEVGLSQGHFVLDGNPVPLLKKGEPPIFGPRLLWPNGCMDQDATCHRGRRWPTPDCVRWGPRSSSRKGAQPPIFGQCLLWPNG